MATPYSILVTVHVLAGAAALFSLPVPLIARKAGAVHRKAGLVFVGAMAVSSVTALIIAASWLAIPLLVKPPPPGATPERVAQTLQALRTYGLFFGYLGVIAGVATWQGWAAIRWKRQAGPWGGWLDLTLTGLMFAGGVGLLIFGIAGGHILHILFGVLGTVGGVSDFKAYRTNPPPRGAWLRRHLEAMLGAATVAVTAFSVQTLGRLLGSGLSGLAIVGWVLPVVLGTVATIWWRRRVGLRPGYTRS